MPKDDVALPEPDEGIDGLIPEPTEEDLVDPDIPLPDGEAGDEPAATEEAAEEGAEKPAETPEPEEEEAGEDLVLEALKAVNPKLYEAAMAAKAAEAEAAKKAEEPETPGFDAELEAVEAELFIADAREKVVGFMDNIEREYMPKHSRLQAVMQREQQMATMRQQQDPDFDPVLYADIREERRALKAECEKLYSSYQEHKTDLARLAQFNREVDLTPGLKPYRKEWCQARYQRLLPDNMPHRERINALNRWLASQGRPMVGQTRTTQKADKAKKVEALKKLAGPKVNAQAGGGRAAATGKAVGRKGGLDPDADPAVKAWLSKYQGGGR